MPQPAIHADHARARPAAASFDMPPISGRRPVEHLVLGEARHGVARLALQLLPPGGLRHRMTTATVEAAHRFVRAVPSDAVVHAHVNDDLLGADPLGFLDALCAGRPLALTLHDVPQPEEGRARAERRAALYRSIAERASLVMVLSHHERAGLRSLGVGGLVHVVDHPVDAMPHSGCATRPGSVGMIGWIHPGKGYEATLDAMARAMPGSTLLALGAPAAGHEAFAESLGRHAERLRLGLEITGYLSDDALLRAAAQVAVPVCAHRHVSASGSLGTWLRAGRVPLVTDGGYAREVFARCPGAVRPVRDLAEAIRAVASAGPAATVLPSTAGIGPTTAESSARQALVLARWADELERR